MGKFILKHIDNRKPQVTRTESASDSNNKINEVVMTTSEKIAIAQEVLNGQPQTHSVKKVKKDRGLIERTESSKIVLTEDNKELLND